MAKDSNDLLTPSGEIEMVIVYDEKGNPIEAYSALFPLQRSTNVRDKSSRNRYVKGNGRMLDREVSAHYRRLGKKAAIPHHAITYIIDENPESAIILGKPTGRDTTLRNVNAATRKKLSVIAAAEGYHELKLD